MERVDSSLDIPVSVMVKLGDAKPFEIATGAVPWPYNTGRKLESIFRAVADALAVENGA